MKRAVVFLVILVTVVGCNRKDVDRLAGMGKATASKFQGLTSSAQGKLPAGVAFPLAVHESPEARVSARLRWDKGLTEAQIEVRGKGEGVVELHGVVKDEEQKQRAVEIANQTVGVEEVSESLSVRGW